MIEPILRSLLANPEVATSIAKIADGQALSTVLIGSRWEGRTTWAVFAAGSPAPVVIIKADHNDAYKPRLQAEHAALTALSHRPDLFGTVPEPVALLPVGNALVLAQTGLVGVPLSVRARQRLRPSPRRSAAEHQLVMDWLTRLYGSERPIASAPVDGAAVAARVKQALPATDRDGAFVRDIRAMAATWPDLALPLLPGHGDLGPSNCLLDGAAVRVFDWEGGLGDRNPLADLVVFLNHYARAQPLTKHRLPSKAAAFRAAFLDDGWLAALTGRSYLGQLARLGLPSEAAEYLLVATLADLANGSAPITHADRARKDWTALLRLYATTSPRTFLRTFQDVPG